MILSDLQILEMLDSGDLVITPFSSDSGSIQPASIDLRLGPTISDPGTNPVEGIYVDPNKLDVSSFIRSQSETRDISGEPLFLHPRQFVIGATLEHVTLSTRLGARVDGKSRLARLGVGVHITAPKIDPGFSNYITLEIFNLGPWTIMLQNEMEVCSLILEPLGRPALRGYEGAFQGSS
ncbi:MAG: dCTP deaminase [Chloroflexi bacterium]|nr:dCTP deaminase [Chloroflexota bacterium]